MHKFRDLGKSLKEFYKLPINCPENQKPRFRVKDTSKGKVRLAFCGDEVVEAKKLKTKAKSESKRRSNNGS